MAGATTDGRGPRGYRTVKMGFVVLVGGSAGLVALTGDPSLAELGIVVTAGLAAGVVLLAVLGV